MLDPFEEVEPAPDIDPWQALASELSRSMMWDLIGPQLMRTKPNQFGQNPASPDVLEAEAKEMWARKRSLSPFGMDLPLLCYMAAETASLALMNTEEALQDLSEEDQFKFRMNTIRLSSAIVESVIAHMLQKGLIKYGERYEFLGEQA